MVLIKINQIDNIFYFVNYIKNYNLSKTTIRIVLKFVVMSYILLAINVIFLVFA
jgi:hypothetical protein